MNVHPHTPINLTLTLAQVEQLGQALGARPYGEVEALVMSLRLQTQAQLTAANPVPEPASSPQEDPALDHRKERHVETVYSALSSLKLAESARRLGLGSFNPEPLPGEPVDEDYGAVGQLISSAMHHLDEALPSGQRSRASAAYAALRIGTVKLGEWLARRGVRV